MELSTRESVIIAFALNCLAIDGAPILNAPSTELQDIAQRVIAEASKN